MNIDVNLLNQINDKMYEIFKKYGEQTVINLLNYRLKNIKKGDEGTAKLLGCFVVYLQKNGIFIKNMNDLNEDNFKKYINLLENEYKIKEESKKVEEVLLNNVEIDKKDDLDKTQIYSSLNSKPKEETMSLGASLFKRKNKLENTGPIPNVVVEDSKNQIVENLESKEELLTEASLETFLKYNEIYSAKGTALGRKQLRTAILDKDKNFSYFTNAGEKKLREKLKENIKISEVPVIVKNILLKNGFNVKTSNEEMCCEMFLTYIDNLSLEHENKKGLSR